MSELTREQVQELADHIANGQLTGYINQWLDHDAALRARVAELERAETERIEWVKRAEQAEEVNDELREQLAALTLTWTTARPTDGGA